jgi:hypothetical protein
MRCVRTAKYFYAPSVSSGVASRLTEATRVQVSELREMFQKSRVLNRTNDGDSFVRALPAEATIYWSVVIKSMEGPGGILPPRPLS